jgi:hypothetical protein
MRDEEDGHRHRLINLYRERFGEHIPLVRLQDEQQNASGATNKKSESNAAVSSSKLFSLASLD